MAWAAGPGRSLPLWTGRLRYAEQFGIAPHLVGAVPVRWWQRWVEWENAKAYRAAREAVEARGLNEVDPDTRALYDKLVLYGRS